MSVLNVETVGLHWRGLCNQFLDLVFPPRCVGCHQVGAWLCEACLSQIPRVQTPFCTVCGDVAGDDGLCMRCRIAPLQIERIRSVVYFDGAVRQALHHLKYRKRIELAKPLGHLMAAYLMDPTNAGATHVDTIVPVPLYADRLRERGYNQAALLAREVARQTGLSLDEQTLVRHRATASQVDLNAAQRKENVRDAFCCSDDTLTGKHIVLIDDVCTTGATLEACAIALTKENAGSVQALTLARAL